MSGNVIFSFHTRHEPILGNYFLLIFYFRGGDSNNFAVLCCNFSNEKLHQCFIESALTAPQELYLQEGLDWDPIRIPDNRGTIGLFTELQPESLTEVDNQT